MKHNLYPSLSILCSLGGWLLGVKLRAIFSESSRSRCVTQAQVRLRNPTGSDPGAGSGSGYCVLLQVQDTTLVAFSHEKGGSPNGGGSPILSDVYKQKTRNIDPHVRIRIRILPSTRRSGNNILYLIIGRRVVFE